MGELLVAFGVTFAAEMGDKSQLLVIAFASRYRPLPVVVGLVGASVLAMGLSALAGDFIGAALPERAVAIGAAVLFAVFGLATLRGDDDEAEEAAKEGGGFGTRAALVVFGVLLVSEFGDKTMFATLTIAARQGLLSTWLGAAAGMASASLLALVVGHLLGRHLPMRALRIGSGVVFLAVALLLGVSALSA